VKGGEEGGGEAAKAAVKMELKVAEPCGQRWAS